MAIIETKNLTYTYPGASKPSIADVSIKVEKGEFVLITGPSGCGKTTLCRCFNGLVPHFYQGELKGEITVAGEDTLKRHTYEMAKHVGLSVPEPRKPAFRPLSRERRGFRAGKPWSSSSRNEKKS